MKVKLKKIVQFVIPIFPLLLIVAIFIVPLSRPGLIVGGDWTFPYSNKELDVFGQRAFSIWNRSEIPTGTQVSHNNLYLFQMLAELWAGAGLDGVSFQKITLFLTIIGIYAFSYRLFMKLTKSRFASTVGALSYLFSPIVFNYLNMGWNFVLLFLALAPLFTQIALDYFDNGNFKHVVALGLITAVGFFQSQSIVWLPLIFTCIFITQAHRENLGESFRRFTFASLGIGLIVAIVHLPWLLPIVLNPSNIIGSTSSNDLERFSNVISLSNQFRLWGSLYNQQFEIAFPPSLELLSYFPIILCIAFPLFSSGKKPSSAYLLMVLLVLVAPTLYIFRETIAHLPLSTIVRDTSRFLVITSLGISLGVAISLSAVKNRLAAFIFCTMLIASASPYFLGRLYTLTGNSSPRSREYKNFRAKLLILPEVENEPIMAQFSNQTNIFLPTGGFVLTKKDGRFNRDFWGVADIQSSFSPIASGVYHSDKSDFLVSNFTQNYSTTSADVNRLIAFFRIYGVNNLFYRSGLESTYLPKLDRDGITKKCQLIDPRGDSDWSVTSICPIKDTYSIIYASVSPQYSTKSFDEILSENGKNKPRLVILGCPEITKEKNNICNPGPIDDLAPTAPVLESKKVSDTKYRVVAEDIKGRFILVFNQTYHPGWIILNKSGKRLNLPHILVNQLVNGWVVDPAIGKNKEEYIIEFYPQILYSKLLPISLVSILVMLFYLVHKPKPKNR